MTPAERLAATRPMKRSARNKKPYTRTVVWKCLLTKKRESLRLSMREVCKATGISVTAYWQIEKGGDPMLTTAVKIAEFFGCPIPELWPNLAK